MRRSLLGGVLASVFAVLGVAPVAAQETGTPIFKAPYRAFETHEFGASIADPGNQGSFALEGFYTYGRGSNDLGLRGGFIDINDVNGIGGGTRYVVGGSLRTRIINYSESIPVDGALTVGLGANFGEGDDFFLIPVGVTAGRHFLLENSSTTFVPYVHPVIVPTFGGGDDDVKFALGLGVNVNFSDRFSIRASGGLGDIEGVGISVAILR